MRLLKVLNTVNQIEKSSFLKIIDNICAKSKKTKPQIERILSEVDGQLKNIDNEQIVEIFNHNKNEFKEKIGEKLKFNSFQLDILIEILVRDGNSLMGKDWFYSLYKKDIKILNGEIKNFVSSLSQSKTEISVTRKRDYQIFQNCVKTAYENDVLSNREQTITHDEKSVLHTLAKSLNLSNEEVKIIYYSVVPIELLDIECIISNLKESGIIFFNRKSNRIFIPDEIVWLIRELIGIELPNKYFRRILKQLSTSEINRISRIHNISTKLDIENKIEEILRQGVCVTHVLLVECHKEGVTKSEIKNYLSKLVKALGIELDRYGNTAKERISNIIKHFKILEMDDRLGISYDGYDRLLSDLNREFGTFKSNLKNEFEIIRDDFLESSVLLDYNIKPQDILYLFSREELIRFCELNKIKKSGNIVLNILDSYKDIENIYLENYEFFARRDINGLKDNGIEFKEVEIGVKFEDLTKKIFEELGFDVDEDLRKKLSTRRDKMDIVVNLSNSKIIIIECKTKKDREYNNYSSISRQLNSYKKSCTEQGYDIDKVLLVSADFSDEFISSCEDDYELKLSLIPSSGLLKIRNAFKDSPKKQLPLGLLSRAVLIDSDRIIRNL